MIVSLQHMITGDDDGDIDDDDGEDGAPVACGCVTTVTGGNRDGVTIRD